MPLIHSRNVQIISQLLTRSTTLRVLDIGSTDIGCEGAACFAGLRNIRLHDLRMARCNLGSAGADKIGEILHYNRSITSVDLRM